ncbi:hypothetical protein BRADI_5g23357v3 [Brachypodium distachyon]|uniref:Epidermal patterning factor-like protein n=2 Tax=Brachypodium distachyon TaxID=15368 RepID=A0A2K2CIU6_BRADI|nr:hypothetical protein BRADI_5g23357v3 [Brachypodium distachyon]
MAACCCCCCCGGYIYARAHRGVPVLASLHALAHPVLQLGGSLHCVSPAVRISLWTHFLGPMRRHALGARRVRRALLLLLVVVVLLLASTGDSIRPAPDDAKPVTVMRTQGDQAPTASQGDEKKKSIAAGLFPQEEVYATGSSLPDCSHACGPCKPCNRVMVSFKCSIAEPCPMVYRCMCKGKCYPVPSS